MISHFSFRFLPILCKILILYNILPMDQSRPQSRQQRIQQLFASLSIEKPLPKGPLYLIDRSFRHKEMEQMPVAEKRVVSHTIDVFANREKQHLQKELKEREKQAARVYRHKLVQSMSHLQSSQSQTHHFFPSRRSPKRINLSFPQHISLEQKYNSEMAYQMQSYLQARRIQHEREKMKREVCTQPPPLLIETLRRVRAQRATVGCRNDGQFPSNNSSIHQQYKEETLSKTIKRALRDRGCISHNSIHKQNENRTHPVHPRYDE